MGNHSTTLVIRNPTTASANIIARDRVSGQQRQTTIPSQDAGQLVIPRREALGCVKADIEVQYSNGAQVTFEIGVEARNCTDYVVLQLDRVLYNHKERGQQVAPVGHPVPPPRKALGLQREQESNQAPGEQQDKQDQTTTDSAIAGRHLLTQEAVQFMQMNASVPPPDPAASGRLSDSWHVVGEQEEPPDLKHEMEDATETASDQEQHRQQGPSQEQPGNDADNDLILKGDHACNSSCVPQCASCQASEPAANAAN